MSKRALRVVIAVAAILVVGVIVGRRLHGGAGDASTAAASGGPFAGHSLEIFVGSASKPPVEELSVAFEKKTGAKLVVHFGGSGQMLSSLKLSGRGDIYFPGSSDFMELAKREGLIDADSERRVVYLIPAVNVQRGNPKQIHTLEDLARPGIRLGIARPDGVCVGLYGVEVLEKAGLAASVKPNIVTEAESCEKDAQLVSLGTVDAVLGWSVFEHWDPEHIETIELPPERVARIGYIPIALTTSAKERELARAFIAYTSGVEGRSFFEKWHYLTSEADARKHALPDTPVGGEWSLPVSWK